MCIDIQLSCQLALGQARKALPFEAVCEAFAVLKKNCAPFMHDLLSKGKTSVFIKNQSIVCYYICNYKSRFTYFF